MSIVKLRNNTLEVSYRSPFVFGLFAGLWAMSLALPLTGYVTLIFAGTLLLARRKNYSIIESLFLSILLLFAATIILYSFTTVLGLHVGVRYAPSLLMAAAAICSVRWLIRSSDTHGTVALELVHDGDIAALIATIAVFITLLIPIFHMSGPKIAQFLSYGEDNASHYALTKYIHEHGDFAYKLNPARDGLLKSLEIYPQGFHVSAATFIGMYPRHATPTSFMRLYALFITLNYSVFIFWFIKLCMRTTRAANNTLPLQFALLAPVTFLCGLGLFLLLLDRGFQPQIFAYSFLAAIICTLDNAKIRRVKDMRPAMLVLMLTVGVAASWWLLLPMPFLLLCQYTWSNKLTRLPARTYIKLLPGLTVIGFAILYPVIVNILLNKKSDPLDEPGGVDPIHGYIFWYLLLVVLLAAPRMLRTIKKFSYTYASLLISLGLLGAIALYQLITIGRLEYYFYKSVYTILLLSIVIFFLAAHEVLGYLYRALGKAKLVVPIVTIGLFFIIANQTNLVYVKVYIHNWFPNAVQPTDLAILFTPQATTYSHIAFVGSCNAGRNYLADRWSGARLESESPHFSALEGATIKNQPKEMAAQLRSLASIDKKLLIVQYPGCTQEIPNLHQIESRPNVKTISRP